MSQFGSCGHCKKEWYSVCFSGKLRFPKHIPTCPEGGIMSVCEECFEKLPSDTITAITIRAYRTSQDGCDVVSEAGVVNVHMTPTEHLLVESAIRGWVLYMKGETAEPPFDEMALAL